LGRTSEAFEQLTLIMGSATKRVRTSSGLTEQPDWSTRLKACRLVLAAAWAMVPELRGGARYRPIAARFESCPNRAAASVCRSESGSASDHDSD
jgi:hypothetical protein